MNVWVGALLYHPVKWHLKRIPVSQSPLLEYIEEKCQPSDSDHPEDANPQSDHKTQGYPDSSAGETVVLYKSSSRSMILLTRPPSSKSRRGSPCWQPINLEISIPKSRDSLMRPQHMDSLCDSTLGRMYPEFASQVTLKSISETMDSCSYCCLYCYPKRSQPPADYCGHKVSNSNGAVDLVMTGIADTAPSRRKSSSTTSPNLFTNPVFIVILLSNASTAIGYTNFTIFLPAYAKSLDHSKTLASYLLSVTAFFDLLGRIGGSTVSDLLPLPKRYYFVSGLLVSGVTLVLLPLSCSYPMLCVACATFGLSSGTYTGITVVTIVEMLGEDNLAAAYTISLFINGLLQLVGPPACGVLYETYKSYGPIISCLGAIVTIVAGVCIVLPVLLSPSSRRKIGLRNS